MPTYSEWLDSTRVLYTTAMTNAYSNRNNADTTNVYYRAWQAMNATGDLTSILAPNPAFYGATPDGDETDILLFQDWLQKNPDSAGLLNLEPTLSFRSDQRSSLGTAGTVGSERRRWKGSPVYTFANGVLIGKDSQIVAAIGTEGGEDLDGFGTDTIAYFDGVPFSTGTGVPGSVVFRGDTVVSGSIRGTGGVVVIDDVIQLETGVSNPAGIGVDKDGKVRLRHRGEGFIDLIDEINTVQTNLDNSTNTATNLAKLWQGTQNTSSARWGTSLIPNGNMSLKTVDASDGYSDRLVGVRSIGTTSNIVTIPTDGVGRFDASQGGIAFQAVPIEAERYAIRIRYRGGTQEQIDDPAADEGLFLSFHETTDDPDNMGDKTFIYNTGSTPGVLYEGSADPASSDFYLANTNVQFLDNLTSTDSGGNLDGVTIQEDYQVKSYVYTPSAGTKSASLVIYARNYSDTIDIDYVVMTEQPLTTQQVEDLITDAVDDIDVEVDDPDISVITDPQMTSAALWAGYKGATLEDGTDGITGGDKAITVTITDPTGGGIISSAIACESDRYLVGAKVRVISSTAGAPVVSMFAIENPNQVYPSIGASSTTPLQLVGSYVRKNISIIKVDPTGTPQGTSSISGQTVSIANMETDGVTPRYTTLVGTYEVTVAHIDGNGADTGSYNATVPTTPTYPSMFSLVVETDRPCVISVDYVYGRVQGASVNIAQSLADTAYSDAHGFVTAMNEQLIKEAGSIITNASMSILDSNNLPSGWRTDLSSGTLSLDTTGDNAIRIVQDGVKTGTRRLITPAFSLGTSDQFSVGVRMRGLNGSVDATVKVAVCTDSVLPTGYVTIAGSDGGNTDVLVTDTVTTTVTETEIATSEITEDRPLYHENLLTTWNRGQSSAGGLASIIVEADDDFEVDFVFVKEQSVSFDLADAQAIQRKDEAIASAAGFVANIGDSLADESGSFISNAGFSSWYVDPVTNRQRPQKWLVTRGAGSVRRAIPASEVTITTPADVVTAAQNKETVIDDKNISGSAIVFSPGIGEGGILSAKFQLPQGSSWTNPETLATSTTTGSYTLSARIKVDNTPPGDLIGVRLYAHEMYSIPEGAQQHVFCKDAPYGSAILEGQDRSDTGTPLDSLQLFADTTEGTVQRIKVINVTKNDQSVGYEPDDGTGNAADEYVEYLPVDNNEDDGDRDSTFNEQSDLWYDISGTYKPSGGAKVVSFEILIDGDVDVSETTSLIYVDYVSLITQPFDADFAQTLADARTESITGITSSGFSGSSDQNGGVNTTLAAAILANQSRIYNLDVALSAEDEGTTLIPNSFFSDYSGNPSVPTSWMPTRNTDGTLVLETDESTQETAQSYGTYLTLGGTDTTRGILSEAIPVVGDPGQDNSLGITEGGLTSNPNFDIAIRYRAVNPVDSGEWEIWWLGWVGGTEAPETRSQANRTSNSTNQDFPETSVYGDNPIPYSNTPSEAIAKVGHNRSSLYSNIRWAISPGGYIEWPSIEPAYQAYYGGDAGVYGMAEELMFFRVTGTPGQSVITLEPTSGTLRGGFLRVYSLSGTVLQETTIGNGDSNVSYTLGDTNVWVQFVNRFAAPGYRLSVTGSNTAIHHLSHSGWDAYEVVSQFWSEESSSEPISLSIIAHEYYDTSNSYDSATTKHVYANGASLVHPTSYDGIVQRYNTGADGATKNLDAILKADSEGNYTAVGTSTQTTSNIWKTLVALYKPFELNEVLDTRPRWVSFEFLVDGDPEGDSVIPEIYIDGILLQASAETPLLSAVKETAETANETAEQAQDDATQALSDAGDALSKANTNEVTIGQHTTTLENIELAQTEAAIVQAGIASEQGSILFNAGFTQSISETNLALPKGYFPFERTPGLFRITNETGSLTSADLPAFGTQGTDQSYNATSGLYESTKSIYLDVGQTGSALVVTGTNRQEPYTSGFYTTALPLPKVTADVISTSTGTTNPQVDRGNYSIAIKVKPAGTNPVSVQIRSVEVNSTMNPESYVYSFIIDNAYQLYGYDADWNTVPEGPTLNTFSNYIPIVKVSESDTTAGGWEIIQPNQWTTLVGTFTPQSTSEYVSFALWFTHSTDDEQADPTAETTPDGPAFWDDWSYDGTAYTQRAIAYVDYILVTPATVSADLARDIAAGEAYEVQQTLTEDLNTLEDNLGSESDSIMPNGNFQQVFTIGSNDYAKNWVPTGTGVSTLVQLFSTAEDSIGTYIKFERNAGNNTAGILSKAIQNPAQLTRNPQGVINNFNLGLRIRGVTEYAAPVTNTTYAQTGINQTGYAITTGNGGSSTVIPWVGGGGQANIPDPMKGTPYTDPASGYNWTISGQKIASETTPEHTFWRASDGSTTYPLQSPSNTRSAVIYFPYSCMQEDSNSNRDIELRFTQFSLPKYFDYTFWHSVNGGSTLSLMGSATNEGVITVPINDLLIDTVLAAAGKNPPVYHEGWVVIHLKPPNGADVDIAWDSVTAEISGDSTTTSYLGGEIHASYFRQTSTTTTTTTIPNFTMKVVAHESFQGIANGNIYVNDSSPSEGLDVPDAHAQTGFSRSSFTAGQETVLNLIDLGYSQSTAATEITIDAQQVSSGDDAGESIQDWRNIVGSYTPSELCTAVSFEIIVDHDPDGDGTVQEVWLDSATLAVSSISADLAETISDNRIFVEQKFGTDPSVPANNIIKNADFSISENVTLTDGSSLKVPSNWVYVNTRNTISDWEQSQFQFSPLTPEGSSTRAVRILLTDESTYNKTVGLISKPFKVTSSRYEGRIVFKESPAIEALRAIDPVGGTGFYFLCEGTNTGLSSVARAVTWAGYDGYLFPSDNIVDGRQGSPSNGLAGKWSTDAGTTYDYGGMNLYDLSYGTTDAQGYHTLYFQWVPAAYDYNNNGITRYLQSDMWAWASLHMRFVQPSGMQSETGDKWLDIYEISLTPVGNQFGSWTGASNAVLGNQAYDDEGDLAPDAPREIEAVQSQYNSIDIEVSDTTSGTAAKNALLLSLPRKIYLDDSALNTEEPNVASSLGPNADGVSYYYPGVSDITYEQYATYPWWDPDGDVTEPMEHRRLIFPGTTGNELGASIHNVTQIDWGNDYDNPTARLKLLGSTDNAGNTVNEYLRLDNQTDLTHDDSSGTTRQSQKWTYFWPVQVNVSDTDRKVPTICLEDDYYTGVTDRRVSSRCAMAPDYSYGVSFYYGRSTADSYNAMLADSSNRLAYISRSHGGGVISFTGQHRCEDNKNELDQTDVGLIVVSSGRYNNFTTQTEHKPTINESLPKVELSSKRNQKSVFGVLSDKEDEGNDREFTQGRFVSILPKEEDVDRLIVNSLGEGAIWICNINGNLENGDYITTCEVPGYGMLQDDDLLHNYTVAKITQDCTFELDNPFYDCVEFEFEGNTYRKAFVGCTYHCG